MSKYSSLTRLLDILEKVRDENRELKPNKLKKQGYKSVICLCSDGKARAVHPGESIHGTNVFPLPRKSEI